MMSIAGAYSGGRFQALWRALASSHLTGENYIDPVGSRKRDCKIHAFVAGSKGIGRSCEVSFNDTLHAGLVRGLALLADRLAALVRGTFCSFNLGDRRILAFVGLKN